MFLTSQAHKDRILERAANMVLKNPDVSPDTLQTFLRRASVASKPTIANIGTDLIRSKPMVRLAGMADDANRALGAGDLLDDMIRLVPGKAGTALSKAAGTGVARFAGRAIPVLGAIGAVGDVGDILVGQDSLANKAMDATAMGVGGTIGGLLGMGNPLLIAGGASMGKAGSDLIQRIVGGGKSAEERKIEEAIALLQQRGLA